MWDKDVDGQGGSRTHRLLPPARAGGVGDGGQQARVRPLGAPGGLATRCDFVGADKIGERIPAAVSAEPARSPTSTTATSSWTGHRHGVASRYSCSGSRWSTPRPSSCVVPAASMRLVVVADQHGRLTARRPRRRSYGSPELDSGVALLWAARRGSGTSTATGAVRSTTWSPPGPPAPDRARTCSPRPTTGRGGSARCQSGRGDVVVAWATPQSCHRGLPVRRTLVGFGSLTPGC